MFPVTGFPFAVDENARAVAEDVKTALDKSNVKLGWLAGRIHATLPRLSEQLNGYQPFTLLWRVLAAIEHETWVELLKIRARRFGYDVIGTELVAGIVEATLAQLGKKRMAKAAIGPMQKEKAG